jgi:hypothetical protein
MMRKESLLPQANGAAWFSLLALVKKQEARNNLCGESPM